MGFLHSFQKQTVGGPSAPPGQTSYKLCMNFPPLKHLNYMRVEGERTPTPTDCLTYLLFLRIRFIKHIGNISIIIVEIGL